MSIPKLISINAFRQGTNKSQICANLGALLALVGKRVCAIDIDIKQPRFQVIFGTEKYENKRTFNDFLAGNSDLSAGVHDVTHQLGENLTGALYVITAREKGIFDVLRDGYDINAFSDALKNLQNKYNLDFILFNPGVGTDDHTLFCVALSDISLMVMRLDEKDYEGIGILIDVAQQLNVPSIQIVIDMVDENEFNLDQVTAEVGNAYHIPVAGILPYSNTFLDMNTKGGIFVQEHADLAIVDRLKAIATKIST